MKFYLLVFVVPHFLCFAQSARDTATFIKNGRAYFEIREATAAGEKVYILLDGNLETVISYRDTASSSYFCLSHLEYYPDSSLRTEIYYDIKGNDSIRAQY